MKIGYARVSTHLQDLALQLDALHQAGCETIYQEKSSGAKRSRPRLQELLDHLRPGDVVVIWKLDRLARSLKDLIELVTRIQAKDAALLSLKDQIDTTTPAGKLTFHLFAALAEFERDVIRERTQASLTAARARGRQGGRPKGLSKKAQHTARLAAQLYEEGQLSGQAICEQLAISRKTLYNYLCHEQVALGENRNGARPHEASAR